MPLAIVKAPVIVCRKCRHSLAVCTCNVTPEAVKENQWQEVDWRSKIELDRQERERRLNAARQYAAEHDKALIAHREEENNMPLKLIPVTERKPRVILIGRFAAVPEVMEMWNTLPKLPKGQAIEVTLPKPTIESLQKDGVEHPVKAIVASIRRKFSVDGLAYDAYVNDESSFTVLHEEQPAGQPANKKK